ncbi:GNAT family N-acetyltransferase [Sphingomonas sp. RB3P16]|uniref:GNAT family N-acetyltransferase n=1 Tax=Parasphingomonas frigoris TaxID=3096163 RepID=UPI002FC80949
MREHPRADYWIVERRADGPGPHAPIPIGRYYLDRRGRVWRAMDMGFLPGRRGFGGALLRWTTASAVAAGAHGVDLHVAHDNLRARRLYLRMGFRDVDPPLDFHQRMIWQAAHQEHRKRLDG